jgi:hypothetical protein
MSTFSQKNLTHDGTTLNDFMPIGLCQKCNASNVPTILSDGETICLDCNNKEAKDGP